MTNPCCRISGRLGMQKESHKGTVLLQSNFPFRTNKNVCPILYIFRATVLHIQYLFIELLQDMCIRYKLLLRNVSATILCHIQAASEFSKFHRRIRSQRVSPTYTEPASLASFTDVYGASEFSKFHRRIRSQRV